MALTADDSSALEKARQRMAASKGGAAPSSASGQKMTTSTFRIPVRNGGYLMPVNQGQFDDDPRTTVKTKQKVDRVDKFDLTDTGLEAAVGAWYAFGDDDRADLMKRMWFLGLTKSPTDFDAAFRVWSSAVQHSARFAANGREMDPRDVMEMMADGGASADGKGKYKQQQTTSRRIDLTDPATAREWVQEAYKASMGRRAEDAEVRALIDALHDRQQATPAVTTTTPTKWDENGNAIESTTTTSGGVDPDAFFAAQMRDDPEAGAHQAAAELFPALQQLLGAGGP